MKRILNLQDWPSKAIYCMVSTFVITELHIYFIVFVEFLIPCKQKSLWVETKDCNNLSIPSCIRLLLSMGSRVYLVDYNLWQAVFDVESCCVGEIFMIDYIGLICICYVLQFHLYKSYNAIYGFIVIDFNMHDFRF